MKSLTCHLPARAGFQIGFHQRRDAGEIARRIVPRVLPAARLAPTVLLFLAACGLARADMFQPVPTPGGIDARPTITSLKKTGTSVTVQFHGLEAPYLIQMKGSLGTNQWTNVSAPVINYPDYDGSSTLPGKGAGSQAFCRVVMTNTPFVGYSRCYYCHIDQITNWLATPHAVALTCLSTNTALPPSVLQGCMVCHNVGFGQQGGFVDTNTTPGLANVQCEACHGPAGAHVNISGRKYHPLNTVAAEVCGGCHDGTHHPTYSEWTNSAHAAVISDLATASSGFTNATGGESRQMSCGPCHSGATRITMLNSYTDMLAGQTNYLVLPSGTDAAHFGMTCVVCHDPHATNSNPFQLRNPIASSNDYVFTSIAAGVTNIYTNSYPVQGVITNEVITNISWLNTGFASQYSVSVQICAQCHNSRGAKWTDTSRPPHHSPQFNMLLGNVGQTDDGAVANRPSTHGVHFTNQCVSCHMVSSPYTSDSKPSSSGHSFKVQNYDACLACHPMPEPLVQLAATATAYQMGQVKAALDYWALNKAPTALRTKYGALAWEYSTPGELSAGGAGPATAEQASLPDRIKKARYNLYMVYSDGSYSVHNPVLAGTLLDTALTWVQLELSQ